MFVKVSACPPRKKSVLPSAAVFCRTGHGRSSNIRRIVPRWFRRIHRSATVFSPIVTAPASSLEFLWPGRIFRRQPPTDTAALDVRQLSAALISPIPGVNLMRTWPNVFQMAEHHGLYAMRRLYPVQLLARLRPFR